VLTIKDLSDFWLIRDLDGSIILNHISANPVQDDGSWKIANPKREVLDTGNSRCIENTLHGPFLFVLPPHGSIGNPRK
jgi:hypothetical protein